MKMGHTVELLKHKAREMLDDMSAKLVRRALALAPTTSAAPDLREAVA